MKQAGFPGEFFYWPAIVATRDITNDEVLGRILPNIISTEHAHVEQNMLLK